MEDIIRKQVLDKIKQINSNNPTKLLHEVTEIVKKLEDYINAKITLEQKEIEMLCKSLTRFTILPALKFEKDAWVGRARKVKKDEDYYVDTRKLSYNREPEKVSLQRMNRKGQSLFYCSFGGKITPKNMISTVLSEVNAKEGNSYYLMASKLNDDIYCAPIGIFDYCRRAVPHPFNSLEGIEELYKLYKDNTDSDGMFALELCDAFLTNILKKEAGDCSRIYNVTSEIANDFLESKIDGIIYPSVKFEGYPNIVLKLESVDKKLTHEEVYIYDVIKNFGYGIYDFKEKKMGRIWKEADGYIVWYAQPTDNGDGTFSSMTENPSYNLLRFKKDREMDKSNVIK